MNLCINKVLIQYKLMDWIITEFYSGIPFYKMVIIVFNKWNMSAYLATEATTFI